jgi:hypothetical protein
MYIDTDNSPGNCVTKFRQPLAEPVPGCSKIQPLSTDIGVLEYVQSSQQYSRYSTRRCLSRVPALYICVHTQIYSIYARLPSTFVLRRK